MKNSVILLFSFILFASVNCARVGRPTGGEKDLMPPVTISATPDFSSTNFEGQKIKIRFNEYIKFEDLNKQLIISPPLNHTPEISPLGFPSKHITIKIRDTLKEDTTYTFNFGNAIVDNSEGNTLKRFKYFFSTGDFIDSLKVSGNVRDAFNRESPTSISVMLYAVDSLYNDSMVLKSKPDYVDNTLDSIGFLISNIKSGKYHLIALDDSNKNLMYDPKEDKIGFLKNAINTLNDTTYSIRLFKEEPKFAIKAFSEMSKNHLIIGYEGLLEAIIEEVQDKNRNKIDFFSYKDRETDSLHIWYRKFDSDSLIIKLNQKDSISEYVQRLRSKENDSIRLSSNISKTLHLKDSVYILSNTPITNVDNTKIRLLDKDSLEIPFSVVINRLKDRVLIDFNKKESNSYSLSILPSAFTDYFEQENDSLLFSFTTKRPEDYGEIKASINNENKTPVIIELLTESGDLIKREFIKTSKELAYPLLLPGKYQLRAIYDENENQKWDSGNFLTRIQPEKVLYHKKIFEVRANWVLSENFILE